MKIYKILFESPLTYLHDDVKKLGGKIVQKVA